MTTTPTTTKKTIDEAAVRSRYEAAGQGHVFDHFGTLSDDEKDSFLEQLDGIAVEKLAGYLAAAMATDSKNGGDGGDSIEPFGGDRVGRTTDGPAVEESRAVGLGAIRRGEVAALVLAGGQGTRLGFSGPKGMYDIGLPSGRTLFRLLAERLRRLRSIAGSGGGTEAAEAEEADLPLYVMTSPINHSATTAYFAENDNFGLPESGVLFFAQGMLPCMTDEGKIILQSAGTVAMAPDG